MASDLTSFIPNWPSWRTLRREARPKGRLPQGPHGVEARARQHPRRHDEFIWETVAADKKNTGDDWNTHQNGDVFDGQSYG